MRPALAPVFSFPKEHQMTDEQTEPAVRAIAQWEIPLVWHRIAELLLPVMQRGEVDNTLDDVQQFLRTGSMQAWHVEWKAIIVTTIQPFGANPAQPTKRVCQIVYCAGTGMDEWLGPVVAHFKEWSKAMGCQVLRISGRRGWARVLPDFKETCTTLEMDVWHH